MTPEGGDHTSAEGLIVQYILECRQRGHFLNYGDYQIVSEWLEAADQDHERLLMILSEVLPGYFKPDGEGAGSSKPITGINKTVMRMIREDRARRS